MAKTTDLIQTASYDREVADLVKATLGGETAAFGYLVERFQHMAFACASRYLEDQIEAQDAVQEAFWEAYQTLSNLRTPAAFPGWFKRIVIKQADRQARLRRVMNTLHESSAGDTFSLGYLDDPFEILHRSVYSETVQSAIQTLPDNQRQVVSLFYLNGCSQKEISSLMKIPVSTIKKRLHDARINLKCQFKLMNIENTNVTSDQERKSHIVAFYIALRAKDYPTIKKYINSTPDLVHVLSEWTVASDTYYWPLGTTPLGWAAGVGDVKLANLLLDSGAAVDGLDSEPMTPLHHAILMEQDEMVEFLLSTGADINQQAKNCLSALHFALMRQNVSLTRLLIKAGADISVQDKDGNNAAVWAHAKRLDQLAERLDFVPEKSTAVSQESARRSIPSSQHLLGRTIDTMGHSLDKRPLQVVKSTPIVTEISPIFETGVKMIDLCMPIKRGGSVGVFTPLSGVGRIMIQAHLMFKAALDGGCIVYVGIEEGENTAEAFKMTLRAKLNIPQSLLDSQFVFLFEREGASKSTKQMLAETARTIAESLFAEGNDVLLVVGQSATQVEGLVDYMRSRPCITPNAAITTLFDGDHTVGLEPVSLDNLDTVLTFSYERASAGLWPALDPIASKISNAWHAQLPAQNQQRYDQAHQLLLRYTGLQLQFEKRGEAGLFYLADFEQEKSNASRGQTLNQFLMQHLPVNEPVTGRIGQVFALEETLAGAAKIMF